MKVVEILKIGREMLKIMQKSCIKVNDVDYIGLYDEFHRLVDGGEKATFAALHLAEKYGISERKVWYVLSRFDVDCKIGAAAEAG